MTGRFNEETPEKCEHYAKFMQHLNRGEADTIFWGLFCVMIFLLITAARMYTKTSLSPGDRRVRGHCLLICALAFIFGLVCVIFSAFAGLHIEFCDNEDLIFFYWSFWTIIQVGSLIAILGISVNLCYGLGEKQGPPWNVALGTPVLVIAALGHAWELVFRGVWRRCVRGRTAVTAAKDEENSEKHCENSGNDCAISRESTIARASRSLSLPISARHIGYTLNNEPLFVVSDFDSSSMTPASTRPSRTSFVPREIRFVESSATTVEGYAHNVL